MGKFTSFVRVSSFFKLACIFLDQKIQKIARALEIRFSSIFARKIWSNHKYAEIKSHLAAKNFEKRFWPCYFEILLRPENRHLKTPRSFIKHYLLGWFWSQNWWKYRKSEYCKCDNCNKVQNWWKVWRPQNWKIEQTVFAWIFQPGAWIYDWEPKSCGRG